MTLDLHIAQRKEIVFIENDVADWQTLAAQVGGGREVIVLDAAGDGLQQMAQALQGRTGIDALHVITHGAEGKLDLGSLALDSTTAAARSDLLASIGASLSPHADMLLYGCDVGAGQGASFVDQLAIATGADVAASSNPTGAATLGGDWNLEIAHGSIETAPVVDAALAAQYRQILAITAPTTLTFASAPLANPPIDANDDMAYTLPGQSGYVLRIDGATDGIGSYGNGYLWMSQNTLETKVAFSFDNGKVFTPTAVDINSYAYGQTLVITGTDAANHTIASTSVYVPANQQFNNFTHITLNGFNNVTKLAITPTSGKITPILLDNLTLASVHAPAPTVASVWTNTASGAYKAGTSITINVDFGEAVTVNTTGGTPTLKLETGATDRNATYAGTSGNSTLVFNYVVQPGDTASDLDYFSTGALALNGATVKSAASGYDADTTLPAPGTLTSLAGVRTIVIDTTAPNTPSTPQLTLASDTGTSNSGHITNDTTPTFTGTADAGTTITVYDGGDIIDSFTASGGTYSWTPSTPLSNGNHAIALTSTDAAGNVSAASGGNAITIDTAAPTVTVTSSTPSTLKAGDTATVTFTFSEDPGTTFTAADVAVSGGTLSALSGTGTTRTATFTPTANTNSGTGSVAVTGSSYSDAAGNLGGAGTALQIAYDTKAPTLTIVSDKATLAAGETATITFVFSEDPGSTFTSGDIAVSGGTLGTLAGVGTTRTATFTPDADVASGTASITVAAVSYADAAGNTGGADASLSLVYHTLAPAAPAQVGLASGSDTGVSNSDGITNRTQPTFSGTATAGATVKLYDSDGTTQVGSGTADGAGNWTITTATLSEGAHTIVAKAVDGYGSASAPSAGVAVVVDTTAPTLTIASDKSALKAGETATVTFTFSEDPGATFTAGDVTVSGGTLSALSGSGTVRTATFTPTADTDNGHAGIVVDAGTYTDAAGNNGAARTGPALTFDTKAPAAPAAPDLASGSDSGTSSADDVTNVATPTFTGAAGSVDAGATVKLYDGAAVIATTTAAGDGSWSATSSTLADGTHTIVATAVDAAGNEGAASAGLAVTIDRTAPAAQVAGIAFSDDTGTSHTDLVTSNPHQTIAITLDAAPQAGETVRVSLDNGATWSTPGVTGTTATLAATLAGSNTLKVQVTDAAGNAGPVHSQAYVLDTAAPAAPSAPDLVPGSDTGRSDSDDITSATQPTFAGTAESGATVTLYDGATAIGAGVATGGTWQITAATPLGQGSHTITATATDAAGNASGASAGLAVQVITTAPTTGIASLALSADSGTSATDFVTNVAAQTIGGTLDAALATGERVQVSLDGGTSWADAAAAAGSNAWSYGAVLATGSHDIRVRVQDAVGNAGPVRTQAYTLDTTAPTLTMASDANLLKARETATITFTFSEDPGATFTAADVAVSGGQLTQLSGSGTVRTAVFTPDANLDNQTASITVAAGSYTDAAGNAGGAGTPVSIYFDTLVPGAPPAPVLGAASDTGSSATDTITNAAAPTLEGKADPHAVIFVYEGDARVVGITIADGTGAWSTRIDALADGDHILRAVQYDAIGNMSPFGAPLVITVDTHAPAAPAAPLLAAASDSGTAGDHITKVTTPTFNGTAEGLSRVTLYDTDGITALGSTQADSHGNWVLTASPLADGAHVLTVRQVDVAGNESAAGPALTVTVDATAPAAPVAPQLQAQSDTGTAGDGITYAVPVLEGSAAANDLVTLYDGTTVVGTTHADVHGHWSIVARTLGLGRHALSVTDTDAAGNVSAASGSFALTVEDAPVPLVDGVPVVTVPVSLPGGGSGTQVQVPIVGAGRVEQTGAAATADIPLAGGTDLLVAHVGIGYGLTASGGANTTVANGGAGLIAAIQAAATPGGDVVHMSGNGQSYLAQLQASQALLVQTIAPVSSQGTLDSVLTLSAASSAQQQVALVIQTGGLAPGGTIALQNVSFAAIVGAANVVVQGGTQMLTGDAASQHITLASGGNTQVFSGGGDDTIGFGTAAAARTASAAGAAHANAASAPATTVLHGGTGSDTATFAGARADFDVETHNGYLVVSSKAAPAAKALVVNVEQLQFSDGTVKVEDSGAMDTLAGIYQTALGRQADVYGIEFWADAHQAGVSWGRIALDIIRSPEYAASHDVFNGNAGHDIAMLYQALFDRAPDAPGLAFWVDAMRNGVSLEHIATEFVESAEMIGHQRAATGWDFMV